MARTGETRGRWLLLVHSIPPQPAYFRAKVGKRIARVGPVAIKNSVYVLPASDQTREDFQWIGREIVQEGGEATLCDATFVEGLQNEHVGRCSRRSTGRLPADEPRGARHSRRSRSEVEERRWISPPGIPGAVVRLEMSWLGVAVAVVVVFAASGCSSTSGPQNQSVGGIAWTSARPSFSADVAPILMAKCGPGEQCHGAPTYATLVGTTFSEDACDADRVDVDPGSLDGSYLIHKLTGVGMCPMTESMPPGLSLATSDIQTIADWICEGAPAN